jgi:hypothetical protein
MVYIVRSIVSSTLLAVWVWFYEVVDTSGYQIAQYTIVCTGIDGIIHARAYYPVKKVLLFGTAK